jgi:hypothetical protein
MYCSYEDYLLFFLRWWADANVENRREDPAIWDDWDEARWHLIRRLCREQHQGRYPPLNERPQSSGPLRAMVEIELGSIVLLREFVRNRIRVRLGQPAPAILDAPFGHTTLLQGARLTRRDIQDGFIDPKEEYGLDKPTALAHCDAIEAEERLAVLSYPGEPPRTQDKDALKAWKERLTREAIPPR